MLLPARAAFNNTSFLFDLNKEIVVDADRVGNISRFFNNADPGMEELNMNTDVKFVNGEHRISLFAQRDIKVGEELLFYYGDEFQWQGKKKVGLAVREKRKGKTGRHSKAKATKDVDALSTQNPQSSSSSKRRLLAKKGAPKPVVADDRADEEVEGALLLHPDDENDEDYETETGNEENDDENIDDEGADGGRA